MTKIYLNILGLKNFETEDLNKLLAEVEALNPVYTSWLYDPIHELRRKINYEIAKRKRSKTVWVCFESYWSGYTSGQRHMVGRFYRKLDKTLVDKLPKYFEHAFTDNTSNGWSVKAVDVPGKNEGSYSGQIDDFLAKYRT